MQRMEAEEDWLEEFVHKFTKNREKKEAWLRAWVRMGWNSACESAGVGIATPSGWTERDEAFKAARARAEQIIADRHESTLDGLAAGDQGTQVQLNALAMRLRGLKPARYRDSASRVEIAGAVRLDGGEASRALELLQRFAAAMHSRNALHSDSAMRSDVPLLPEAEHGEGE